MITLIRHGQASFGAADYDQLSPLGQAQALRLGQTLKARGDVVDHLISGPMKRHRQTAAGLLEGYGPGLPDVVVDDGFAEFPAFKLVHTFAPQLRDQDDIIAAGYVDGDARDPLLYKRAIFRVIELWAAGRFDSGDLESFADFDARVQAALERLGAHAGERVIVATSGGPVGISVRRCLGLEPERTMQLAWNVVNASMTDFSQKGPQPMLFRFNDHSHLSMDAGEVTFV